MLEIGKRAILNLKIGRKLGSMLGAIILQLALLMALSAWSLLLVKASSDRAQEKSGNMLLAWRVSSDIAEINTQMGDTIISADLKLDSAQVISLGRDCVAAMAEMKAAADTDKGKKMMGILETAMERWKTSNAEIVKLASLGQRAAATEYYRTESQDRYGDVKAGIGDLLEYRRDQLEKINVQRNILLKKIIAALLGIGALVIGIAVVFGRALTKNIARPLEAAALLLTGIAGGDISHDVPVNFLGRGDEIGSLAQAMQSMSANLREMVRHISDGIEVLSSSSKALLATSLQMTNGSRNASDKAHLVSAATGQMSSNITSIAAGMEQTTANLGIVATSTEQMTATIGEIAVNSEKARRIAGEASEQAARIRGQIDELGEAAQAIGKITETITEISSQTNLLALNATIEAARAGSAGKGFAVVATEIKALAQQTAAATQDIKTRIGGVQTASSAGISQIGRITQVIGDVSAMVGSIAAAIEEQATATKQIARNIALATTGVSDANTRVSETSIASREIAADIVGVDQAASEMASGGEQVRSSAVELSDIAGQLKLAVARFQS
jgi:methyl-accepting chemotaxis protein